MDEIFGNPIKVGVLRSLALGHDGKSGRELARILSVSSPGILKPLQDLEEQGILTKKIIGKSHSYRLNRNNLIVSRGVLPLFQLEKNLLAMLARKLIKQLPKNIDSAIWHGSLARGTATANSDWDILLLCKNKNTAEKIRALLPNKTVEWSKQYSSRLDIQVMTTEIFRRKFRSGDIFARNVYEDYIQGQIPNPIFGKSLLELLGG